MKIFENKKTFSFAEKLFKFVTLAIFSVIISVSYSYAQGSCKFTVLYTNDVHGRLMPFEDGKKSETVGGAARRIKLINEIKSSTPDVLLLDGGDTAATGLFYKFFYGESDIKLMNSAGYTASAVGNHEFDSGFQKLKELTDAASFPFLSANISVKGEKELNNKIKKYTVKEINGCKVGIIGITTSDIKSLVVNGNKIKVKNEIKTVKKYAKKLQKSTDFLIVLSHSGYDEDVKIARQVPQVDLIVGGHSHTFLDSPKVITHEDNSQTLIVQDGEYGKYLGRLDITAENGNILDFNSRMISVDNTVTEGKEASQLADIYAKKAQVLTNEVIGITQVPIDSRKEIIRTGLSSSGKLILDAVEQTLSKNNLKADVIMLNSGGIRSNKILKAGKITTGDIIEMFPFDNKIITANLTGKDIKSILETSSRQLPKPNPAFVQSKGISYTVDLSAQPQELSDNLSKIVKEGSRVSNIKINGQTLIEDKYYTIASNDFMLGGGDGFVQFKNARKVNITNLLIYNSIIDFVKINSPLNPQVEDEITVINPQK